MARLLPYDIDMKRTTTWLLALCLLAGISCSPEAAPTESETVGDAETTEPTLEPVFEPASAESLERGLGMVLDEVDAARQALDSGDSERAATVLDTAHAELRRLADYDLPLLRAQEQAFDAIRHFRAGDVAASLEGLDSVQEILQNLTGADIVPAEEMQRTMRLWTDARLAVEGDSPEAVEQLNELGRRLHNMRIKSDLVLPRKVPEEDRESGESRQVQ